MKRGDSDLVLLVVKGKNPADYLFYFLLCVELLLSEIALPWDVSGTVGVLGARGLSVDRALGPLS